MTGKILLIAFFALALCSCNTDKDQEKALLDSVTKAHDKSMADDEAIMKIKMQLKPYENIDQPTQVEVGNYYHRLDSADNVMMTWMNKFNPVFTGKSHDEIMDYLHQQQAQITKINAQLDTVITASNKYIAKIKGK